MNSKKSLKNFTRGILVMLGLLALIVGFAFQSHPASAHNSSNAYVRVVHAAPGAGPVDVYVDGAKLLSDFKFGTVTNYVTVAAGCHKIQVTPYGDPLKDAVINVKVSLKAWEILHCGCTWHKGIRFFSCCIR